MSDEFLSDEETDHLDPNIRAELRKSKERARLAEQALAEAQELRRELAFTKAGIPETGTGALLRKAYDGDTDPEAIREAAAEYGVIIGTEQPAANPLAQELNQHRAIAGATGTNVSGPTSQDSFMAGVQQAGTREETLAAIRANGPESGVYVVGYE